MFKHSGRGFYLRVEEKKMNLGSPIKRSLFLVQSDVALIMLDFTLCVWTPASEIFDISTRCRLSSECLASALC